MFQLGYDFFSLGGVTLGAKAKIAYTAPFTSKNRDRIEGNFKDKGSFQHGAELYARKKFNKWSLQGGLSYMDKPLDTNEYKSNLRSIGVGFKVAIHFGWNEE